MTPGINEDDRIKVFVHLPYGQDAGKWKKNYDNGLLAGLNDPSPYGYARAKKMGCTVRFSQAAPENIVSKAVRGGLRLLLGFDIVHALRNRREILKADVIWTHTETQHLAIAAALYFRKRADRPKLIGQSIWLLDNWSRLTPLHRALFSALIAQVDVLTFHSPLNTEEAKSRFPGQPVELVLYGIPSEGTLPVRPRGSEPVRILSIGNDRHRDWETLVAAFGSQPGVELTIASRTADRKYAQIHDNIHIAHVTKNAELRSLFDACSVVIVPLKQNKHVSGITVIQEAAVMGAPIVATDVGGLRAYFQDDAVLYVPASNPARLSEAVLALARDPERAARLASTAQARMTSGALGCDAYIGRHVELSKELLGLTTSDDDKSIERHWDDAEIPSR